MSTLTQLNLFMEQEEEVKTSVDLIEPNLRELYTAVQVLLPDLRGHLDIEFTERVRIRMNRRKLKEAQKITVKVFESTQGFFCYTFYSRTGYPIDYLPIPKIKKISLPLQSMMSEEAKAKKRDREINKILNKRYDETTWSNLSPENLEYKSLNLVYMKSKFLPDIINDLEKAFKSKGSYRYTKYAYSNIGNARDLSIETKMCKDGVFRAWYSSEYAGCGNGDYYILLNPYVASFGEKD